MKKVLLVDDKPIFHRLWMLGIEHEFVFLHAYTSQQARDIFSAHADINAIVIDACMDNSYGINWRTPIRLWGFNTGGLISELRQQFTGPIIAAPCQWWHFQPMRRAGCTYHVWKWRVAALLKKFLKA